MKTVKGLLIVWSAVFNNPINAQNFDKNSVESATIKLKEILENSISSESDYRKYINNAKNINRNTSSELTGKVSVTDFAILCTTTNGNLILLFVDSLKARFSPECPPQKHIKQYIKQGSTTISVATCINNNTEIDFEAKLNDVIGSFARVQSIAKEFCETFNYIIKYNIACEKEFEQNYRNTQLPGGTANNLITEDQRKLIIQANYFNDNKNYAKALEFYNNAIKINQFSYPDAYYNMALIAAELKYYNYAILNMKKYLLLKPDADDARKAQDKIYEWDVNINN